MEPKETVNGQLFEGAIKGGTPQLFPSKELLIGRAKNPRGYDRHRMLDVQQASRLDPKRAGATRAGETARLLDNLARSTVPSVQLHGSSWYPGSSEPARHQASGLFIKNGTNQLHIAPGATKWGTPLHELGHSISHQTGTWHSAYDTSEARGAEEAYAENFADTHFRDRRGRPHKSPRQDETGSGWADRERGIGGNPYEFSSSFKQARQASPVVQAVNDRQAVQHERMMNGLDHPLTPRGHVLGQVPLLEGVSQDSGADETVDWDYTSEHRASGMKRATATPLLSPKAREIRARRAQMPLSKVKRTP